MSKFELKDVRVTDGFFSDYAELVRTEVIPYQWEALNDRIPGAEKSGCIHNFRIAAGEEEGEFVGMVFQDSDLGKWLEAVAYSLTTHPDKKLEAIADDVIDLMARARARTVIWTPISSSRSRITAGSACATATSFTAPAIFWKQRSPIIKPLASAVSST